MKKLSDLVEVWRGYNKNNFACFLLRHGVDCVDIARRSSARGRQTTVR